jgi:hypothetical protein
MKKPSDIRIAKQTSRSGDNMEKKPGELTKYIAKAIAARWVRKMGNARKDRCKERAVKKGKIYRKR